MSAETNLRSVDYSALTAPIDLAEVAAFEAETTARGTRWTPRLGSTPMQPRLIGLCVVFVGVPLLVLAFTLLIWALGGSWGPAIALGPTCIVLVIIAGVFIVPATRTPRRDFGWEQYYRLSRFAGENGLNYEAESANPTYPGLMFTTASGFSIVYNHLTPQSGRFWDLGNLRFGQPGAEDTAMSESGHRGFLAVHLGGQLPHVMLDAKANDGIMGGMGGQLSNHPTVRLEGDFNRHFTLYCPVGYERDALYILTPDLMADLLDETLTFDVELIGEWMFVYAMQPFDSMDPALYARLFRIIETVGQRAVRRSVNYRDDLDSSPQAAAAKQAGSRMRVQFPRRFLALLILLLASLCWIPLGLGLAWTATLV